MTADPWEWWPEAGWDDMLSTADIAEVLGVTRQRVYQLAARGDFPEPRIQTRRKHARNLWLRADVIAWAEANGREVTR